MAEEEVTSLDKDVFEDEHKWDQAKRAEAVLQTVLSDGGSPDETTDAAEQENQVSVSEALQQRPVLNLGSSGRNRARVLFVTSKEGVLVADSVDRKEYIKLAEQFDEVHVICLVNRVGVTDSLDRAANNLWFYKVHYGSYWGLKRSVKQAAKDALSWNGEFRPDVVVGIDPFEAGLAAYALAEKYRRPIQLHISTNHLSPNFKKLAPGNDWRFKTAKSLLKKVKSVRTSTSNLQRLLEKQYKIMDISVLPRFYNIAGLLKAEPVFNLREKYPDFAFIILGFGPLTADSYLHDLFTALHKILKNPRIGLIVIGDGPARDLFTQKVKLLGIERSVVFERSIEDLASYLKTANALVEVSVGEDGDARVMQAAAAGLPIIAKANELRSDLFKNEESALLSDSDNLMDVTDNVSKLINQVALRQRLADTAKAVAESRIQENSDTHYQAVAATIESVLIG